MTTETILDYWFELRSHQSDWAFRAYDRLVNTLSKDVQKKLQLKENVADPYVVIFGKTQVGKTTLLLDLIGIHPDHIARASDILRGGQAAGRSATATATEYCCSEDDRWGLSLNSNTSWFASDEKMMHEMKQLREKMESGCLIADSPCVVHIPKQFFVSPNDSGQNIRILDLPGDNPANEEEQKHVNQMAKTYLPFADMILLIGRGDDLSFLRPEVIALPSIEDWQSMPHRFRIVTTYSYSAQSVKDIIRNNENIDTTQLRRRLIEQIALFGTLSDEAKNEDLYFPLEFGSSWLNVKTTEPTLHERLEPIITKLRNELLEQIHKYTSPAGRLSNILNTHVSIKHIHKKKIVALKQEIDRLGKKEDEIRNELKIRDKITKQINKRLSKLSELMTSDTLGIGIDINKEAELTKVAEAATKAIEGKDKNKCKTLQVMVHEYHSKIKGIQLEIKSSTNLAYWRRVRRNLVELDNKIIDNILNDAFDQIRSTLDNYTFDSYLFSSNYQADLQKIHTAGEKAITCIIHHWKDRWKVALRKTDQELQSKIKGLKLKTELLEEEQNNAVKQQKYIKREIEFKHAELKQVQITYQDDLERCNRFVHLLNEEYLNELSNRLDIALQEDDDCNSLLQVLSCVDLKDKRSALVELTEKYPD